MKSLNKTSEILIHDLELETNIRKELPEVHLYFDYEEDDGGMTYSTRFWLRRGKSL
jgi:hypothetical protein